MTCAQLGGPCTHALPGATADAVIKAQDAHLKDAMAGDDDAHQAAAREMSSRWKHPLAGMGWYRKVRKDFAALPEDQPLST